MRRARISTVDKHNAYIIIFIMLQYLYYIGLRLVTTYQNWCTTIIILSSTYNTYATYNMLLFIVSVLQRDADDDYDAYNYIHTCAYQHINVYGGSDPDLTTIYYYYTLCMIYIMCNAYASATVRNLISHRFQLIYRYRIIIICNRLLVYVGIII